MRLLQMYCCTFSCMLIKKFCMEHENKHDKIEMPAGKYALWLGKL